MPRERFHSIFILHPDNRAAPAPESALRLLTCSEEHATRGWPFATPPTLATIVTRQVMGGAPVLYAAHELDGTWTFLHDNDWQQSDLIGVCHQHVVDLDRSLRGLANLPRGWAATRRFRLSPWSRERKGEV